MCHTGCSEWKSPPDPEGFSLSIHLLTAKRNREPTTANRELRTAMEEKKTYKLQGELVELRFLARAAELGLRVSKPYRDSAPYDFLVESGGTVFKVQVVHLISRHQVQCLGLRYPPSALALWPARSGLRRRLHRHRGRLVHHPVARNLRARGEPQPALPPQQVPPLPRSLGPAHSRTPQPPLVPQTEIPPPALQRARLMADLQPRNAWKARNRSPGSGFLSAHPTFECPPYEVSVGWATEIQSDVVHRHWAGSPVSTHTLLRQVIRPVAGQ